MIEKLHRYRGLLVFGLILVAAAFVFGDFSTGRSNSAGASRAILEIAGKTYGDRDFHRMGSGTVSMSQAMMRMGDYETFYQFVLGLAKGATSEEDLAEKFFVGRMLLRNAKDDYGIHPDEIEVAGQIRSMRAFVNGKDGFDEKKYREFVDKDLGRLGLTENDLLDLASDMLAAAKLKTILAAGIVADRETVAKANALQKQQITAALARLDLAPFEDKLQPTEEEIKSYWEPVKDGFKTTPRRKFSYLLVTPSLPEEAAAEPAPAETIADVAATDEAKAAAKKKREEELALKAAKAAEERRKKQLETDALVDSFTTTLSDQNGAGFEDLAKKNQWEIKTTDLFIATEPPPELDLTVRATSTGGKAVAALFQIRETSDPGSKFSNPIPVGEGQWLIARLDGEEKERDKTYAEARAEARAKFIEEKAAADLKAAAETALTKIKEAVAAGKSFADAAKEAGVTETKNITAATATYKPDGATEPANFFQAASKVDPGGFADVLVESDRAFILHVEKREVVKDPNAANTLDAATKSAENQNETLAFDSWLAARVEAAKVVQLYKQAK